MSDQPGADSAGASGEATGASVGNPTDADSTPTQGANGQEQGSDQSKRVNDLMSLANRRLLERDQALAEIEALKAQLAERQEATTSAEADVHQPTQVELMYPERYEPEDDGDAIDPLAQPEPPTMLFDPNAARRPDQMLRPSAAVPASSPAARFARDQGEIGALKAQLDAAGQRWYEGAKAQGLLD